ncbi:MAG: general secretion pathway protein GspB [Burkholderiaceae bacterium]
MSYILDALRKADAERERGAVPGIHAQPVFAGAAPSRARAPARPWLWAALSGVGVLIAAGLWLWLHGASPTAAPAPVAQAVTAAPAPAPAPVVSQNPLPPPLPVAAAAAPAPPVRARRAEPEPRSEPVAAKPASKTAAAEAVPKEASGAERVYTLKELPDDVRRQLPTLSVGGSMYSKTPADRILIINGSVLHEGDRIGPDLVLRQIKLKAAVLDFKGYRYGIAY